MNHDAGGKIRNKLPLGMEGHAQFSACGRYRLHLSRYWVGVPDRLALWIGMNPSVADASFDDPTIRREVNFTRAWGLGPYLKMNVMDYRATNPKELLRLSCPACSEDNLVTIVRAAKAAEKIILAYGVLPGPLRQHGQALLRELRAAGHKLWCVGLTKDGSPRHPLYVAKDNSLIEFPGDNW